MMALCVDPARINEVWPHVSQFIKSACEYGDDTFETTQAELLGGKALLWLACDGDKVLAAAASKIWKSPKYKICSVLGVGGIQLHDWKTEGLKAIETYAKLEGCDLVRLSGREGWKRIFIDYEQPWIVLEKRLK